MRLFPDQFERSENGDPFDLRDFYTVDNLVRKHIYDELKNTDYDLLISHLVAVDHVGHYYGPDHP